MFKKFGIFFISPLVAFFFYRNWFTFLPLASGDWPYLFKETIQDFSIIPQSQFLWLGPYYQLTSKFFVQLLGIPWEFTEKIAWFLPFLVISYLSSFYLAKTVLPKSNFVFVSPLIFLLNTYTLMIVGGGQMGFAMSYAFAPLVLATAIGYFHKKTLDSLILAGLGLGLEVMFDPRVGYVTFFAVILYLLISSANNYKKETYSFLTYILGGGVVALVINSPWILVQLFSNHAIAHSYLAQSNVGSLRFFSFGSFSQSISLLQPNWPENIFGKTYFLKPEFLFIPFLAFSSLLFVKDRKEEYRKTILFFTSLALLGIFLSKGTQDPFGEVYSLLFSNFTGFYLFRDPTKFYVLIVLSYSILIPFSLEKISNKLSSINYRFSTLTPILFVLFWFYLIRPTLFGQLSGTFKPHPAPIDYVELKNFLVADQSYSKTLWVPSRHVYTFYSNTHPFLEAAALFGVINQITVQSVFGAKENKEFLQKEKVGYVILDEDTDGTLFTKDRKYSEEEYRGVLKAFESISYLKQTANFGKIVVFKVQ